MSPRGTHKKSASLTRARRRTPTSDAKMDPVTAGTLHARHVSVVGIGASAGGLEALKAFFAAMPSKTGLSFVVVVHLDPTHDSLLPELLAKITTLSVEQAQDRQLIEADHVYIIPPNRILAVDQGLLQVREVVDRRGLRGAIDHFFRSLADDQGDRAIAIVLSGTGTEGTLGARAIKGEGGMVMAQAPETASQPGMPGSVIAAGLVDRVLAPDRMPEALLAYLQSARAHETAPRATPDLAAPNGLSAILAVVRGRTKYDFRGYKKGTLQRRVARRMGLRQIDSLAKYADYVRANPVETDHLSKDLLIGVTSFFRDPQAFEELAGKVLAGLVKDRDSDSPIRVWIPGCSTGEEAYSIAILLAEQTAAAQSACRVQVFATDVDDHALDIARSGTYPESITLDVTPERLQRFFTREDHRFTIVKSIRQSVTFAVQNVISDPPFSKLDLVSCRNLLIYLEPEVQEKLLALFHFAIVPGGYLFLGGAESIGSLGKLFTPISKRGRIFRRLGPVRRAPLEFPAPLPGAVRADRVAPKAPPEPTAVMLADQQLLEHLSPAAVVVRRTGEIVRFYGAMDRYIRHPSGEATLDVLALARDELKPTMRAALHDAVRHNRQRVLEALDVKRDRGRATLRITVRPVRAPDTVENLWLMIFEEQPAAPAGAARPVSGKTPSLVRRLEAELRATKKEQQHLIEQLEGSNEELKAANEEILSMNEELQSTNEELTTSKEELQSMNEELTTLNAQLQDKVHELTAVNDDLANLLVSTDIATVFVDTNFRVKRFTKAATRLLNLLPADVGRPISHLATNLVNVDLSRDARTVLTTLAPVEKEVTAKGGSQYLVRVLPYRTEDQRIQGVVLTLVDVTTLKRIERDLRAAREQLAVELHRMVRLHEVSVMLSKSEEVQTIVDEVLAAAIEATGADMGNIQMLDESSAVLTIAAQHGFEAPFLEFFREVKSETDGTCGRALATHQQVIAEDIRTSPVFAGSPSLAAMQTAGVQAVQSTPLLARSGRLFGVLSTHFRAPHAFDESELRWLDLLTRHAAELIVRRHTEELLAKTHAQLEQRVADRTKWLTLMHDVTSAINDAPTWDEGLHRVLRRICETGHWQLGFVYMQDLEDPNVIAPVISCFGDERFRPFYEASEHRRYTRGQSLPGRAYAEGNAIQVNGSEHLTAALPFRAATAKQVGLQAALALPVSFGSNVISVLELFSAEQHPPNEVLETLMNDVSAQIGKVLERERVSAQMTDLVWREQQGLLHTLHDSLGQTLTGLGMLSASLRQQFAGTHEAAAETARQVAQQAQLALDQVRQLSRGLFPVEVDPAGLLPALRELAATTEAFHKIRVQVSGEVPGSIRDSRVATQLYRIVQEAVTNAMKHAKATTISIELAERDGLVTVRVCDDGVGIQSAMANSGGLGLRIMRYRASTIGAQLTVDAAPDGGTLVACTLRGTPSSSPAVSA
jgi:two-component system, chemotaxis family, CheB/CheR fusion protein